MNGEYREGEFVTVDGEPARVQRYAPSWIWVVTVKRYGASITMRLDEALWSSLRERPVSGVFATDGPSANEIDSRRRTG